MTIKKGEDWGSRGPVPSGTPIVDSDLGLANLFSVDEDSDLTLTIDGPELVGLLPNSEQPSSPRQASNGLASTLGARGSADELRSGERTIVPIDLGVVTLSGPERGNETLVMASSLVICSRFWSGVTEAAMNSAFLGPWNVTPTGHPNDGRFDVVRAEMSMSDRWKARSRLTSGTHLPHPDISVRRLKKASFTPAPSARVWIDGRCHDSPVQVDILVIADAVQIAI